MDQNHYFFHQLPVFSVSSENFTFVLNLLNPSCPLIISRITLKKTTTKKKHDLNQFNWAFLKMQTSHTVLCWHSYNILTVSEALALLRCWDGNAGVSHVVKDVLRLDHLISDEDSLIWLWPDTKLKHNTTIYGNLTMFVKHLWMP